MAIGKRLIFELINLSTVTGVQGKETDILIYSPVKAKRRTRRGHQNIPIGIVADLRPLYVLVSRANCHLYIIGGMHYLAQMAPAWYILTDYARPMRRSYDFRRGGRTGRSGHRT